MGSLKPSVQRVTAAETDAIVTLLAQAFAQEPFVSWFVGPDRDEAARLARMAAFFRVYAALAFRDGAVYATPGYRGAALWIHPGQWQTDLATQLRWLPDMVRITGLRRLFPRLFSVLYAERYHPADPHYYLLALGTAPLYRGQGIGTALMAPMLRRCDREGMPAYLEASSPDVIPFYERLGFDVQRALQLPLGGPEVWLMWREPAELYM